MALTLRKIAIKDPDSSDMVVLSNIIDGVDGAATFGWSQEEESVQIEDNQKLDHSLNGELDIKVLRASDADTTIIDGLVGKRVEISGWGIDGFLVFRGLQRLVRVPDFNSAVLNDQLRITVRTVKGYTDPPFFF